MGQIILLALVIVPAWVFGGVWAHFQAWCFVALLTALGCWIVTLPERDTAQAGMPLALVPLLLALGLGIVQLVPVPASWRNTLQPQAAAWYRQLMPVDGWPSELAPLDAGQRSSGASAGDNGLRPLSIYPLATRRELALLAMAAAAFALGAHFFQREKPLFVLLAVAAINGAAVAFYGIVQKISHTDSYLGYRFGLFGSNPFGPFMNRNNGAGYLNLSLACAVGILFWLLARTREDMTAYADGIPLAPRSDLRRFYAVWIAIAERMARLNAPLLAVCIVAGLILAGIVTSMSRGGWLALFGGVVVMFALRAGRRARIAWWPLLLAAILCLGLVSWLGLSTRIQQRFESMLDVDTMARDSRLGNWSDSLHAATDSWLLGTGLGTYGYAYLPYQKIDRGYWFKHAENQYVEALVNGGVVGLALLLAEVALVGVAAWKLFGRSTTARSTGVAVCGLLLVATQALQAFVDFGLYTPANLLLAGLLGGAICGRAALMTVSRGRPAGSRACALPSWSAVAPVCLILVSAATLFGWRAISHAGEIEDVVEASTWRTDDRRIPATQVEQAINRLTSTLRGAWDDAIGQSRLAELWIHLYRLRAFEALRLELPRENEDKLWFLTDLSQIHARAAGFALAKNDAELNSLRQQPVVIDYLDPAWRHLLWARAACPWFAKVHLELAALCFLTGDPLSDQVHLDRLRLLAGSNPNFNYSMAIMDLDAERTEQAYRQLKVGWAPDDTLETQLLDTLRHQLTLPQMLEKAVPDSPELLMKLARQRYGNPEQARDQALVLNRAEQLIPNVARTTAERYHLRGMLASARGNLPEAIDDYRRAIDLDPDNAGWQQELRELLQQLPSQSPD